MTYTVCEPEARQDRDAILDLWRRNLPEASPARYHWLYENGPATGLLLEAEDGRAVGSAGLMRRTLRAFGQTVPAGQSIDLNVDRDHRTIGPALGLSRAVIDSVSSGELRLIYGFPNQQSEAVLRRLGYKTIGNLGRWIRPLSSRIVLQRHAWPAWLCSAAALVLDPLLRLTGREFYCRRPRGMNLVVADEFDERFDRLWHKASRRLPIAGERTARYLRWRFSRCPQARYRVLCLSDSAGELLGYLVYGCRDRVASVADFLFTEMGHFELLLAEFLRLMWRERTEAVVTVYLGSQQVCRTLERFGFWPRPSEWKAMVYADRQWLEASDGRLPDPESWYFTRADLDTDE